MTKTCPKSSTRIRHVRPVRIDALDGAAPPLSLATFCCGIKHILFRRFMCHYILKLLIANNSTLARNSNVSIGIRGITPPSRKRPDLHVRRVMRALQYAFKLEHISRQSSSSTSTITSLLCPPSRSPLCIAIDLIVHSHKSHLTRNGPAYDLTCARSRLSLSKERRIRTWKGGCWKRHEAVRHSCIGPEC